MKKPVLCDTRAACCMLWVTITIVYRWTRSCMRSSIASVEIEVERREHGSSEDDLGLDGDGPRDAQPLLLAARELEGVLLELVLDLVPQRGPAQDLLDPVVVRLEAVDLEAEGDVVLTDFGKGLGFWKTMPMRRRTSTGVVGRVQVLSVEEQRAVDPGAGMRSFIRLRQRRKVVFPQPDGGSAP